MQIHLENTTWLKQHPEVAAWLKNRPIGTQRVFLEKLKSFSEHAGVSPEEWRKLDKFQARDMLWRYVEPMKATENSRARSVLIAAKSWYRNLNGETLPLDSGRGGKHQISVLQKKAGYEHIPDKNEVYRIVDMAGNLRDKAILLTFFQSGIRENALQKLPYGMVKDQLSQDVITLKITRDIDTKLAEAGISFYYTFLNGEGAQTLREYCQVFHKNSKPGAWLFYTKNRKNMSQSWLLGLMKKCIIRAGMDPKTMWVHSFRKAFRKILRKADIDDEDKEELMGHVLKGSREAYFDRCDAELLQEAYEKCNFSREVPKSEVSKLRAQLEDEQSKRSLYEARVDRLEKEQENTRQLLREMLEKKT